jgi:hypothetical protein
MTAPILVMGATSGIGKLAVEEALDLRLPVRGCCQTNSNPSQKSQPRPFFRPPEVRSTRHSRRIEAVSFWPC